jgi:hypothetical protein
VQLGNKVKLLDELRPASHAPPEATIFHDLPPYFAIVVSIFIVAEPEVVYSLNPAGGELLSFSNE